METTSNLMPYRQEECRELPKEYKKQTSIDITDIDKLKKAQPDLINTPPHYTQYKIEPIDFIMKNKLEFWQGNIIKYIMRFEKKNGVEDLKKARTYLNRKISELETSSD